MLEVKIKNNFYSDFDQIIIPPTAKGKFFTDLITMTFFNKSCRFKLVEFFR